MLRQRPSLILAIALFGGLTLASLPSVLAHEGATGVVKERMDVMKSLGKASKALRAMFKGEQEFAAAEVKALAAEIESHAEKIDGLFPEGTDHAPSEASPKIWSDMAGFKEDAADMKTAAAALAEAADTKADALQAFIKLGQSCKACHESYRIKKD